MRRDREKAAENMRARSIAYALRPSKPAVKPSEKSEDCDVCEIKPLRYHDYIKSVEWRVFRVTVLAKRGTACEVCRTRTMRPQIHHLTYERLGKELDTDVVVACDDCHRKYHGLPSITLPRKRLAGSRPRKRKFLKRLRNQ